MHPSASRSGGMLRLTLGIALMLALVIGVAANRTAAADVNPPSFTGELAPGESITIDKLVDVPESPEKADVYFLADTTGSMFGTIAQVQADAAAVLASIQADITDVQFGAGDYKDFPYDAYAFQNTAAIGPDDGVGGAPDASDAIATWSAGGGVDGPEGQLFALDQISDSGDPTGIGWRPGATRIVVWFGDAPGHDPVCSAISGLGYDITEGSVTTKLVSNGVTVVAISVTSGYANALDDDPTLFGGDYVGACGAEGGLAGQATRIAGATGGVHLSGVAPSDIADAITSGIGAITWDITAQAVGCDPLVISWAPASHDDVVGPTTVNFVETISVPGDATGQVVNCTVEFLANGGVIATQDISVEIVDIVTEIVVNVDIKPTSCPNPINTKGGGVLPVAILGTADFDASQVDASTVTLEHVSALRSSLEDVATPYGGFGEVIDRTSCTTEGPDGFTDLTLKFDKSEVLGALEVVPEDGDVLMLKLTGQLLDGTPISGWDVVWIVSKGK